MDVHKISCQDVFALKKVIQPSGMVLIDGVSMLCVLRRCTLRRWRVDKEKIAVPVLERGSLPGTEDFHFSQSIFFFGCERHAPGTGPRSPDDSSARTSRHLQCGRDCPVIWSDPGGKGRCLSEPTVFHRGHFSVQRQRCREIVLGRMRFFEMPVPSCSRRVRSRIGFCISRRGGEEVVVSPTASSKQRTFGNGRIVLLEDGCGSIHRVVCWKGY